MRKQIVILKSNNNKPINLPTLNNEQLSEIDYLKILDDNLIDTKDIPELTREEYKTGHLYYLK